MIARLGSHSGDGPLRADQRLAYLLLNAFDNRRPVGDLDPALAVADFRCLDSLHRLADIPGTPSPSRALSDLFWMHLPWEALTRALGPLCVLDLGCGSGQYVERLQQWSGGRIDRYVGVDVQAHPGWAARTAASPGTTFKVADIEAIDRVVADGTNLIVSQSTIEHVQHDGRVFDQLHAYAHRLGKPLLQVHLVPSAACLRLYLWHGYRQYTPRTLSPLSSRFADCSERLLVRLGGARCNALHYRFVTWPVLIRRGADPRDAQPGAYRRALADAIQADMQAAPGAPSFYALLIYSKGAGPLPSSSCWLPVASP